MPTATLPSRLLDAPGLRALKRAGFPPRGLRSRMDRPVVHQRLDSAGPEVDLTPADLASLTMPLTVMWGGANRLLHPQQRDWFRQHLPRHARFEERPAWGHSPYVDPLPELATELTACLSRPQGR